MTEAAKHALVILMISEAIAEACTLEEITPDWVDYQLQRIFRDYRPDYRQNVSPEVWAELDKWEKAARQTAPTIRQLAMIVAQKYVE